MHIESEVRETGTYVIRTVGEQRWSEGGGTWQAPGVRLDLMRGRTRLAVCKLEVPGRDAVERGAREAEAIEPWVATLRHLDAVRTVRDRIAMLESLAVRAADEEDFGRLEEGTAAEIDAQAIQADVDAVRAQGRQAHGTALIEAILIRLRRHEERYLARALAAAPRDVAATPIHPAWKLPATHPAVQGEDLDRAVAQDLLTAWALMRDRRDPLITWAVTDVGVPRSHVQQTTGVSRTTINRLIG